MDNLFENQDSLNDLENILFQIKNFPLSDQEIIDELNNFIGQLTSQVQERVLKFIKQEFQTYSFFEGFMKSRNKKESPIDFNEKYKNFFKSQQYEQILDLMKNQHFWKEIKILNKFSKHSTILIKLGQRIMDFLTIIENSEKNIIISQYQLFSKLLGFVYNRQLDGDEQQTLEQMIGSILTQQIFEIQDYLDNERNNDKEGFNDFQQKLQIKQMNLNNVKIVNERFQFFFELFSQDILQTKLNLDSFFIQKFSLSQEQLNTNQIMQKLDEALRNKKQLFNECYFQITIYYWSQSFLQVQTKSKLTTYLENSRNLKDFNKKKEYFEIFQKSLKINDEIYLYFLRRVVLFIHSLEQEISLESYKNYKNSQNEIIRNSNLSQFLKFSDFLKCSNLQIDEWQQTIKKLSFHQLYQLKTDDRFLYLFSILLWKEQINISDIEFILQIFKQKPTNILSLVLQIDKRFLNQKGIILDLLSITNLYFKNDCIDLVFLENLICEYSSLSEIKTEVLQSLTKCYQLYQAKDTRELQENCQKFYKNNQLLYEKWLKLFNYFNMYQIRPEIFSQKAQFNEYPQDLNFSLEQFNITLAQQTDDEKQILIKNWVLDSKNGTKFSKLIPFFFNIIKRGDTPQSITEPLYKCYEEIEKQKNLLNMKALFQLLYNNSNIELKVMLLKLQSKQNPVPFIYKNPKLEIINNEEDLFILNHNLYFVISKGYTIINFTLSRRSTQIGKTELINKIFYKKQKFEIQDLCEINNNTIDIMFDFSFNQSRFLTIADAHGTIPISILKKILPFFQFWIIQMDTEQELEENYEAVKCLKANLQKFNPLICFIVRNSVQDKFQRSSSLIDQIQHQQISIHYIKDLKYCNLDQGSYQRDINQVSKFIFNLIKHDYLDETKFKSNKHFYELLQQLKTDQNSIRLIEQTEKILGQLDVQLEILVTSENGFYSKDGFQIRNIQEIIKQRKNEIAKIYQSVSPSKDQIQSILKQITDLENQLSQQHQSKVVTLFIQALQSENNYILYLQFSEFVQKFNQKHTFLTSQNISKLNETISEQKKIRRVQQAQIPKEQIEELQNQLKNHIKQEKVKYIDIQLFWRELTSQQSFGVNQSIKIDLVNIVYQLLKKGESFEFLDGDNLKINFQFLKLLADKFKDKNEGERVLVLSVLGPQSSGKSTILNKIFGCHFLTSIGRCTKGINLQLLKIENKEQFNNQFDHILILDSEGLQSPNKADPEFDKKIALLLLSVSDIILITIMGSMTNQFKDLIEMCIYTLGQMKSSLIFFKQLSWCFNLQNDLLNKTIFLQEFETILQHLNDGQSALEEEEKIDYSEILDINERSIQMLGNAQSVKTWEISNDSGVFKNWQQLLIDETFSRQAYNYGLQTIKYFSEVFGQKQNKHLTNLEQVVQGIHNNWESLIKLPDLLEFSELKQLQNNDIMKGVFENALKQQNVLFIQDIVPDLQKEVNNIQNLNLAIFNEIQKKKEQQIKLELNKIQQNIEKSIQDTKSKFNISKKITQKYLDQLDQRMLHFDYECRFIILEQIKGYERDFQEKEGFQSIESYIFTLRPQDIKQYQLNPNLIEIKFNELWNRITQDSVKQQEQIFSEFQLNEFKSIKQAFPKYSLSSEKEQHYLNFFIQNLNTLDPFQNTNQEKEKIFKLFSQDQTQEQFFVFDNQKKYYRFSQIFCSPIKQKLKSTLLKNNAQLLSFNQLLEYKFECSLISKQDIKNYLKQSFSIDLKNFVEKNKNNVKLIESFIKVLLSFQISFDENSLQQLLSYLIQSKDNPFNLKAVTNLCNQFIKSLKLDDGKRIKIKSESFIQSFREFYPKIQIIPIQEEKISKFEIVQMRKQEIMQQNIMIKFKFNQKPSRQVKDYIPFIDYIISPQNNQQFQNVFNQKFPSVFNDIMNIYDCWRIIYFRIYEIIQNEMIGKSSNSPTHIQQHSQLESQKIIFSVSKISLIMNTIEQEIKNYCNQLSMFGVIFTSIGERCIYYCSLFIIWRFICFQKWQMFQVQQNKFAEMKNHQYEKFLAEIQQNRYTQSIIKAKILSQTILQGIKTNFYQEQTKNVKESILKYNQDSFQLIKFLDLELLQKLPKHQEAEIIQYITDQKEYIKKYVDRKIKNIQSEIFKTYSSHLRESVIKTIQLVLKNASILNSIVNDSQPSQEYFKSIEKQNSEYYDCTLYKIVLSYLQGQKATEINYLKDQFKSLFKQTGTNVIIPIGNISQIKSNNQIQILKSFIEELQIQLQEIIENSKNIELNFDQFSVQNELDLIKKNMIGCQETCPLCNRKCDNTIEVDNHRHMCQNGHQLRGTKNIYLGMNQVLIENKPSLCTCEEIDEEDIILIKEINQMKTWSEIKKLYPEWKFRKLEITNDESFIKMMKAWNSWIGQKLCKNMELQLKKSIPYQKRYFNQRTYQQSIHLIFVLDCSGSMINRWKDIQKAVLDSLKDTQDNKNVRVSVIIFNHEAKVTIDCEKINIQEQQQKLTNRYGDTNFIEAFKVLKKQIEKTSIDQFSRILVLFYTDCEHDEVSYPKEELQQLTNLQQKRVTTFIACTNKDISPIVSQMIDYLSQHFQSAEFKEAIDGNLIKETFVERLSNKKLRF